MCGCVSKPAEPQNNDELRGVWITYSTINQMAKSKNGLLAEFTAAINNVKDAGLNAVFVHVRAFCDSLYPSSIFPLMECLDDKTDYLRQMIEIAHSGGISFHAWINPYRVSSTKTDVDSLPQKSPVVKALANPESSGNIIGKTKKGIYLNPASVAAQKLIVDGVREIVENYNVDGIHMDDYFYPTTDAEFDKADYSAYTRSAAVPLSLANWRRSNVNALVSGINTVVKGQGKNIQFGISPAADLNRCYNTLYADIEGWIGGEYVDYIMPQLYFGFEYPNKDFCFDALAIKYADLVKGHNVKLYCGLAPYKLNTTNKKDSIEWNNGTSIVAEQIEYIRQAGYSGFVLFSYTATFSTAKPNAEQLENIKQTVNAKQRKE